MAFDKNRLIQFAKYYQEDFSNIELMVLDDQLQTYIMDVRVSKQFLGLKNIGDLAQKMVETKKKWCVSISLSACYFGINFTRCDGYCREGIFCYEYY